MTKQIHWRRQTVTVPEFKNEKWASSMVGRLSKGLRSRLRRAGSSNEVRGLLASLRRGSLGNDIRRLVSGYEDGARVGLRRTYRKAQEY